jgi:type VI secretion system protein ImpJ
VYGVLRQIVGELSSFSADISASGELADGTELLAEYDHKHLYDCFSSAQGLITRLLNDITSGPEYIIPLHFDGTYFAAEIPPGIFEGDNRFYLVMETRESPEFLIESIRHIAKLSARESLPILIAQSLPGVKMTHLDLPPQELPRKSSALYFKIDEHSKPWDQIKGGSNIALYWDTAPEDLKIELMVVRRKN